MFHLSSRWGRVLFKTFDQSLYDELNGDLVDALDVGGVAVPEGGFHGLQEWLFDPLKIKRKKYLK